MNNVVYDLFTGQIRGIDRDPLPAEKSIEIPYPIAIIKTVEEKTVNMVQKVNEQGQLLYKMDVTVDEVTGEETYAETTEARTVTKYETQTFTYKITTDQTTMETVTDSEGNPTQVEVPVYTTISPTSEVPIEWVDNEAIMIEEVISRTFILEANPFMFTRTEVEEAVAQSIVDAENAPPTEIESLRKDINMDQGAIDFIIMNF